MPSARVRFTNMSLCISTTVLYVLLNICLCVCVYLCFCLVCTYIVLWIVYCKFVGLWDVLVVFGFLWELFHTLKKSIISTLHFSTCVWTKRTSSGQRVHQREFITS